jgi:4-alpha-glucanotransferase
MEGYSAFCQENSFWLEDYALYTVLRQVHGVPWQQWPWRDRDRRNLSALRRKYAQELEVLRQQQYQFFTQWDRIHRKATDLGISLIGDLPIYAALDSAEVWAHRELFQLDDRGYPTLRAGCPPDYFSPEGQDWGNPLYNWPKMAQDGYQWWKARLRQALHCFDFVRLDHFRSFAAYYAIPAGQTPKTGYWMPGVGIAFFRELVREFGRLPIVAEDLGILDSQVTVLLQHTGLSGMNVWQFSQEDMAQMDAQTASHRVFFSGTHDNQTLKGFLQSSGDPRDPQEILSALRASPASAVILPVQDLLGLGDEARINVPGVPTGNWTWRMTAEQLQSLLPGQDH